MPRPCRGRVAVPCRPDRGSGPALVALLVLLAAPPAAAQPALTLAEAMARARTATPAARASASAAAEAAARLGEARAGYLPVVDVSESVQRGDQPVYVFGSLLSQRRFSEAGFAIDSLNHPDPLTNTRTAVTVSQPVYDAGRTRLAMEGARLSRDAAGIDRDRVTQDLAFEAASAFVAVLRAEADRRAADAAQAAAAGDLERSRARRDAGLVTDADVLAVTVHQADMEQRRLTAEADAAAARLDLARLTGAPLSETLVLVEPVADLTPAPDPDALVAIALEARPELRGAVLRARLAENRLRSARAAFLPTLGLRGGWEANGLSLGDQQSSWLIGAEVQANLFRGGADAARAAAAGHAVDRARFEQEQAARQVEVEVRSAAARLAAAVARDAAGRAAVDQAQEAGRIIRDRYESGLLSVTDLLHAEESALDAASRATAARLDLILARLALDRAVGRL